MPNFEEFKKRFDPSRSAYESAEAAYAGYYGLLNELREGRDIEAVKCNPEISNETARAIFVEAFLKEFGGDAGLAKQIALLLKGSGMGPSQTQLLQTVLGIIYR